VRRPSRLRAVLPALVLPLVLLAGCGVPVDERHRPIELSEVPFELLDDGEDREADGNGPVVVQVPLVRDGRLALVDRRVEVPAGPDEAVRALLRGPTEAQLEAGFRSAVPSRARLISLDVRDSLATLDLGAELAEVSGEEQLLAVAQLVIAADSTEGVEGVDLQLEGRHIDVPLPDGSLSSRPVSTADYAPLLDP
jgi:hypothetical protein